MRHSSFLEEDQRSLFRLLSPKTIQHVFTNQLEN